MSPIKISDRLDGSFLCECMGANNNDIARLIIDITPVRRSCFMVFQNVAGSQNARKTNKNIIITTRLASPEK